MGQLTHVCSYVSRLISRELQNLDLFIFKYTFCTLIKTNHKFAVVPLTIASTSQVPGTFILMVYEDFGVGVIAIIMNFK